MKYIWEAEDITVGRMYVHPSALEPRADIGYACTVLYMIGYTAGRDSTDLFCSVSIADGQISGASSGAEFAEMLNKRGMVPATHAIVMAVFEWRRDRTEGRK